MENVVIKVAGMSCEGCVRTLGTALAGIQGVSHVDVSLAAGEARIGFDPAQVSLEALRAAIEDAGFDAA